MSDSPPSPPSRKGRAVRLAPWILFGLAALFTLNGLRPLRVETGMDHAGFGRLPVLLSARVQPMDSVGMNALRQIRGTREVPLEGFDTSGRWGRLEDMKEAGPMTARRWHDFGRRPEKLSSTQWLMEALMHPARANRRYIFAVNHPDLIADLQLEDRGLDRSGLRFFSYDDLHPQIEKIQTHAENANEKAELRGAFERAAVKLSHSMLVYMRLQNSLSPQDTTDFAAEIEGYLESIPPGLEAIHSSEAGEDHDKQAFDALLRDLERYDIASRFAYPLLIPPEDPQNDRDAWASPGASLIDAVHTRILPSALLNYAEMSSAYAAGDAERFNQALARQQELLDRDFSLETGKAEAEFAFNQFSPFSRSIGLYLIAFLLACLSWFGISWLNRTATLLTALAALVHTGGLITRMVLEGRPPVTNLYSSAIFVGWGAVILGLVLERLYRDGVGNVIAGAVGVVTLIIAHNLSMGGDTMEMMQAVLDTNFWLATHVVIITLGYSATFVAGFLALVYIVRGLLTTTLTPASARAMGRMVYGTICFATLFSFVGTILGGIWADQSWGRFWGWDPKENGALLIVIWNALILHCRWGGMIRERGLMILAVFGNVVTAFSWFGVNLLAIGLHSYGFMDGSAKWILYFTLSQLAAILAANLPLRYWMSSGAGRAGKAA